MSVRPGGDLRISSEALFPWFGSRASLVQWYNRRMEFLEEVQTPVGAAQVADTATLRARTLTQEFLRHHKQTQRGPRGPLGAERMRETAWTDAEVFLDLEDGHNRLAHMMKSNWNRILLAGDWHCQVEAAANAFMDADEQKVDAILHVGDFGVWTGMAGVQFADAVAWLADRFNIPVFFIDGNHEDFDQIENLPLAAGGNGLGVLRRGVYHIPRGSVWHWGGYAFAGFGGAASVDRLMRYPGRDWWPQEMPTAADLERLRDNLHEPLVNGGPVDVMVTHDAPTLDALPPGAQQLPMPVKAEADESRRVVYEAVKAADPKLLVHGHYHRYVNYTVGTVQVMSLGKERDRGAMAVLNLR